MNSHAEYRRHSHPAHPDPAHHEPSHVDAPAGSAMPQPADLTARSTSRVAWVRPTDLAAFASPALGRGIDLQAELTRRARRSPVGARSALRHRQQPWPLQVDGTRALEQQGVEL